MTRFFSKQPRLATLDKPIFISADRLEDLNTISGNKLVASVKWGKKVYQIELTVEGENQNLAYLKQNLSKNSQLARQIEELASTIFGISKPRDGQTFEIQENGSITIDNELITDSAARTDIEKTSNAFKQTINRSYDPQHPIKAICSDKETDFLDLSDQSVYEAKVESNRTPSANSLSNLPMNTNPIYEDLSKENPIYESASASSGKASIQAIKKSPTFSRSAVEFRIFANDQERCEYYIQEAEERAFGRGFFSPLAKKLHKKEVQKIKDGLERSKKAQYDYTHTLTNISPELKEIVNPELLTTHHKLFATSSLNHTGYINANNEFIFIEYAAESSSNPVAQNPSMGRVSIDRDGQSIAYTGQMITKDMALTAIRDMIKVEYAALATSKSKLKQQRENVYELPFLVNGLLSSNLICAIRHLAFERPMIEAEAEVLKELYNEKIKVKVKNGKEITVQVKPFFINTGLNDFTSYRTEALNGLEHSRKISIFGDQKFKNYVKGQIKHLHDTKDPDNITKAIRLQQALTALDQQDEDPSLDSIHKLINRAFICEILNLTFYTHCKSSLDRTSIATGIISAVHQIIKSDNLNMFKEKDKFVPHSILHGKHSDAFKDLVILNATAGSVFVQISRTDPHFKWSEIIPTHLMTKRTTDLIRNIRKPINSKQRLFNRLFRKQKRAISLTEQNRAYQYINTRLDKNQPPTPNSKPEETLLEELQQQKKLQKLKAARAKKANSNILSSKEEEFLQKYEVISDQALTSIIEKQAATNIQKIVRGHLVRKRQQIQQRQQIQELGFDFDFDSNDATSVDSINIQLDNENTTAPNL